MKIRTSSRAPRTAVAALAATAIAVAIASSAAATTPDDSASAETPAPATTTETDRFVVAQHLAELGSDPLQWQLTNSPVESPSVLSIPGNLFITVDAPALASPGAADAAVELDESEVLALRPGTSWTIAAGTPAPTLTVFGLGLAAGGSAPVGEPFTVTPGWYDVEVWAQQLPAGTSTPVPASSGAVLAIATSGLVDADGDALTEAAPLALSSGATLANAGTEAAAVLLATLTPLDPALAGGLSVTPPPGTDTPVATNNSSGTDAPPATPSPPTTEAASAPTANDDSVSTGDSTTVSMNVLGNDDRGNPEAVVVEVDGGVQSVGEEYGTGTGTFRLDEDGSATFSVTLVQPGATYTYSVGYTIANASGESSAVATFEIQG